MKRLSLKSKIVYSIGGLGYSLVTVIHMLYLVYFFFPPKEADISYLIPQEPILKGLTVLGIIMAAGRLLDALTDPIIANWSDNCRSPLGKRIPFLRRSALGFAASYVLVFFVPMGSQISGWNVLWVALWLISGAVFLTLYMVPHTSLMVEIAEHPDDKIDLATINSAFWFVGFLVVSFSTILWGVFQNRLGMEKAMAMRVSFIILGFLGFLFMMVPACFLKETKGANDQTEKKDEKQKLIPSMKKVLKNRNFSMFLAGNTIYTIATHIFEAGMIYYITVLALMSESAQGPLTTIIGAVTLVSYPFINFLSKKIGKRKVMMGGFVSFGFMFAAIALLGVFGLPIWLMMGLVVIFAPLPQSIFGVLPNAITADCAAHDKWKTGEDSAAMYVAVNGFIHKLGGTLAAIIFTSFLLLGKDVGNDRGIRMAVIFAAVLCALGILFLSRYNEEKVLAYIKEEKDLGIKK